MARNHAILAGLVLSCVLFMQIGCQEHAQVTASRSTLLKDQEMKTAPKPEAAVEVPKVPVVPEKASTVLDANQAVPKITFEKEICDFGEVGAGTTKTCEFRFTNTGDGLLEITEIGRCCGVVAKIDRRQYAPGESGILTVQPHFSLGVGSWSRQVYVNSNDRARPRVALTMKANIMQKIDWEPKRLKLALSKDGADCPNITLRSSDNRPFSITAFKSTDDCITADYDPSVGATEFVLQPKVKLEKLRKGLSGIIYVGLTHPECDTATIIFEVLPRFKISPLTIVVFDATPQRPLVRKVWIMSNVGEDFEVESTSSQNNIMKVLSQEKVGSGYQLEVQVTPPAIEDGREIFTDVLSVNIKGGEKLLVSCRGFYSGQKGAPRVPARRGGGPASPKR